MSDEVTNKKYKRKRKKTFLQNARKYAKKGYYGRGSHMDEETYSYFVRILEVYKEGFDSDEEKEVFVNNVFEQTEGKEVDCSCNQVGCRVVEMLLPFANDSVLRRFMDIFSSDLRPLCNDRFASHVLEALIKQACKHSNEKSKTAELVEYYKSFAVKVSKFLLNNLEDYVWDTYGNHVIRSCLENFLHIPREDPKSQGKKITNIEESENLTLDSDYIEIAQDYAQRLLTWPQFSELCHSEITSGFLQVLLKGLHKCDLKLLKKYIDKFLTGIFVEENEKETLDSDQLPKAFLSKPLIMLLETALQVAPSKKFSKIYAKCFAGKLAVLSKTRNTNFAVQKLVLHCTDKSEFENIFDEICDHFKEIIETGHSGVVYAVAQTCKKLAAKQGLFVQGLMKSLNCFEPEQRQDDFVLCMAKLSSYEEIKKQSNENLQKDKLNLHGTLMLQIMLEFNKPIKIVNSILNMSTQDVKNLFSNSMGSHIVDSFVKSTFIGEKSREKLVRKLKGTYQDLAASKYGSRSFEAVWNVANLKSKLHIMDELSHKDGSWSNSDHGKIIAGKVNLVLYKRNKEDWKKSLTSNSKPEDLFSDVLR